MKPEAKPPFQFPWPPTPWVPEYDVEDAAVVREDRAENFSEEARLVFSDWLGRPVSLFARRSYPEVEANGAAVLHIVGGAQTIHPGDLAVWTDEGYAAASFDWQIDGVGGRPPERTSRFPAGVVAQFSATPSLAAAMLPVAVQAASVCLHWLARCPGVDGGRLGVTGISWGGYLAWLLAAYDDRVRALVPAFACGGLFAEGRTVAAHAPEVRAYWERCWEPAALGPRIEAPVCYLNGTNDFFGDTLVAESLLASLRVPFARHYAPNVDHSLTASQTLLAKAWMRRYLLDGPTLPEAPCLSADGVLLENENGVAGRTDWWAEVEGPSMCRCWLRGAPPRDRRVLAFASEVQANGLGVSSPIQVIESVTEMPPGTNPKQTRKFISFGLGWRWELGGARHFSNEAEASAPSSADQPWVVVPARPTSDEVIAVLLHFPPEALHALAGDARLILGWSGRPQESEVIIQLHERTRTATVHTATCTWREGVIGLSLGGFETLPPGFTWSAVGRLQIDARQDRRPFRVGPLRRAEGPSATGGG